MCNKTFFLCIGIFEYAFLLVYDSILLTESGEVYTFGWGADGQTGLAHYQNEYRPSLVKGDLAGQHIIKVACVADCVLALSGIYIYILILS